MTQDGRTARLSRIQSSWRGMPMPTIRMSGAKAVILSMTAVLSAEVGSASKYPSHTPITVPG